MPARARPSTAPASARPACTHHDLDLLGSGGSLDAGLIFGVAAVEGFLLGLSGTAPLLILAAMLLAALALTPFATAAALRLALE